MLAFRPASLFLPLALVLAVASAGCKRDDSGEKQGGFASGDKDAPVPVETVTVKKGPIEDTLRFSSTLRAEKQVQVLSRTAGHVKLRKVEEGDQVEANQVLLRIEAGEQSSAVSAIDNDLAQARKLLARQEKAHARGLVSDQALEQSRFEVERLEISRRDASRSLGYTTVRAPIGGTVSQRLVKYGDLVVPNQPLYEIVDLSTLVAEVFVPEKDIGQVEVGGQARLLSPSSDEAVARGEIVRISPVVDPRSGTVKVTVDLPDSDQLRPGMFVDVHLVVASVPDAVLLPRRALVYDNDEPYVFKIAKDDQVERVRVDIEIENRDHIKPRAGFAAGDRVVVAGQVGLKDGAKVEVSEAPGAAAGSERAETETGRDAAAGP